MQTYNDRIDPPFDAAGGEGSRKLDRAAQTAHETVDRVHHRAAQVTDRVTSDGERMYADACEWVASHPVQAVAGALVAGYLIGRIRS